MLPTREAELAEHRRDVVAHGPGGQMQGCRDLGDRLTSRSRAQHVELPVGERAPLVAQGVSGDLTDARHGFIAGASSGAWSHARTMFTPSSISDGEEFDAYSTRERPLVKRMFSAK